MTATRANAFGDLSDFKPRPTEERGVDLDEIDRVARDNKFPSRQPPVTATSRPKRRHTTGRSQQLNVKATSETIERFYRLADAHNVVLGELLKLAIDALESQSPEAKEPDGVR